jgi:hypothetical protein
MANDLNGSPLKIDTPGTVYAGRAYVKKMVWQEPAAAAEDLLVLDSNGRTLWDENSHAGGTGISIEQDIDGLCDGIYVKTIDSGVLYIYYMDPVINDGIFRGVFNV